MASAKQIAWRKKFARMSKAGKFKKSKKTIDPKEMVKTKEYFSTMSKVKKKRSLAVQSAIIALKRRLDSDKPLTAEKRKKIKKALKLLS